MTATLTKTKGKVYGIISNLVIIEADGPFAQNEICYIIATKHILKYLKIPVVLKQVRLQSLQGICWKPPSGPDYYQAIMMV